MIQPLPPLASLRAFDAVARLGSVKAASDSLRLTPSAISHQIRALETHFGLQLVKRSGRNLVLTDVGALYAGAIVRGFNEFIRASELLDAKRRDKVVRLSVTPTFAMLAALPNIDTFRASNPQLELRLETSNSAVDFERDTIDAAVQLGPPPFEGLIGHRLLHSRLIPCAAPAALAKLGPVHSAGDLVKLSCIDIGTAPDTWAVWFERNAPELSRTEPAMSGDSLLVALQMAMSGQGVLLAPFPLVFPLVANGSLKALTKWGSMKVSNRDFYFTHRRVDRPSDKIKAVQRWLKQVAAQLEAGATALGI